MENSQIGGSRELRPSCHKPRSWDFKPNTDSESSNREAAGETSGSSSTITDLDRQDSVLRPSCWRYNFGNQDFADPASGSASLSLAAPHFDRHSTSATAAALPYSALASSRSRCPMTSHGSWHDASQQKEMRSQHSHMPVQDAPWLQGPAQEWGRMREENERSMAEESHRRMTREDDLRDRFKRPKSPGARQNCIRQYHIMQQRCLDHACEQTPCFDEACTFGLPQDSGCRYSGSFYLDEPTSPCMWGWGKVLVEHAERYGREAAMMVDLETMAQSYRERHKNDQRFTGPALVRDPPDAPDGSPYYVVVRPSEQNR